MIDGVTEDGIHVEWHQEDRFADTTMEDGEYLETWVEFLPEEVLNHTAPAGSIPLILASAQLPQTKKRLRQWHGSLHLLLLNSRLHKRGYAVSGLQL